MALYEKCRDNVIKHYPEEEINVCHGNPTYICGEKNTNIV